MNKFDWLVFNAAWLGVMFAGVEKGLAIAIGLSVLIVLYKTGFPHLAVLGRLPGTTVYRYNVLSSRQCLLTDSPSNNMFSRFHAVMQNWI